MVLKNKVAIITGGVSGLGLGMAKLFLQEGAHVIIADIDKATGEKVVSEYNTHDSRLSFLHVDVTNKQDVKCMIQDTFNKFGVVDILINNAGFTHLKKPITEVSEEEFDKVFTVNVKAIYFACLEVIPIFRKQGYGCIINTSSTAAERPRPGLAIYNSSKGAVSTLTKSLAAELAPINVRVNAICPVIARTGMFMAFTGVNQITDNADEFIATIPLRRMAVPEDVANAALFLARPESGFITGVTLEVDGGRSI